MFLKLRIFVACLLPAIHGAVHRCWGLPVIFHTQPGFRACFPTAYTEEWLRVRAPEGHSVRHHRSEAPRGYRRKRKRYYWAHHHKRRDRIEAAQLQGSRSRLGRGVGGGVANRHGSRRVQGGEVHDTNGDTTEARRTQRTSLPVGSLLCRRRCSAEGARGGGGGGGGGRWGGAPLRRGGWTKAEGTSAGLHGRGRPAEPPPPYPVKRPVGACYARERSGNNISWAGEGQGAAAWLSGRTTTPGSSHQLVHPMRGGEGAPGSQAESGSSASGGRRETYDYSGVAECRERRAGPHAGGLQPQGQLETQMSWDHSRAAGVVGQVWMPPPVGRGRQAKVMCEREARRTNHRGRVPTETCVERGTVGGGKGVSKGGDVPSTEGSAAEAQSGTSNSRDPPRSSPTAWGVQVANNHYCMGEHEKRNPTS